MELGKLKKLIKAHRDSLAWLEANNEAGHHDKNIANRKGHIVRLEKEVLKLKEEKHGD